MLFYENFSFLFDKGHSPLTPWHFILFHWIIINTKRSTGLLSKGLLIKLSYSATLRALTVFCLYLSLSKRLKLIIRLRIIH